MTYSHANLMLVVLGAELFARGVGRVGRRRDVALLVDGREALERGAAALRRRGVRRRPSPTVWLFSSGFSPSGDDFLRVKTLSLRSMSAESLRVAADDDDRCNEAPY